MTTEVRILEKPKMQRVEGQVYCLSHGSVHEDTLDPYGEGYPTCYGDIHARGVTARDVHRGVYYRARKGDYDEERA